MRKIAAAITLAFLVLPIFAAAAGISIENPIQADTFEELLDNLINFIFNLSLVILPLMILIGAFYFITAGGNASQVETGKRLILYAIIGFIIILCAKGLVRLVREILT